MVSQKELFKKTGRGISKTLLIAFFVGGVFVAPGGVAGAMEIIGRFFEGKEKPDYPDEQINRALRYLQSRKLIDIQRQYQKEVFVLTKLGRRRAEKLLKYFGIPKPKAWDGKWRMVIFDIPHTKKHERDLFRQQLKKLGFANVQKSIWVHPYECRDQIYYLAGNMFLKPYVRYVVAEEITGVEDLRRRFEL